MVTETAKRFVNMSRQSVDDITRLEVRQSVDDVTRLEESLQGTIS